MELRHKAESDHEFASAPLLQPTSEIQQIPADYLPLRFSNKYVNGPRHLLPAWREVESRLQSADRVALFMDFDGTLVPIAPWPDQVRLSPRMREHVESIARKDVMVGIVSGRRLADLRSRAAVGGIWYVGTHGYFLRRSGGPTVTLLNPEQKAEMAHVSRRLARELRNIPGVLLESKQATVAVHYRHASRPNYRKVFASIRRLLQDRPQLSLLPGKKVWELFPGASVSKWTAIKYILELEQRLRKSPCLVVYLGDDAMDERVFHQMQGISVVVGRHRRTAAEFFLNSTAEVEQFLERFSEVLT